MLKYLEASLTTNDACMYWNASRGFLWSQDEGFVLPFTLFIPERYSEYDDEYGEVENEDWAPDFADCVCSLRFDSGAQEVATGRALLQDPEYILHRFPVDYVPLNDGLHLCRVDLEPPGRRAFKGMSGNNEIQSLPLLDHDQPHDHTSLSPNARLALNAVYHGWQRYGWTEQLWPGIAEVLSLGTPAVMRRMVSASAASILAKEYVKEMFLSQTRNVAVPDFSVALIRHRSRKHEAYVMLRGMYIGTVRYEKGTLVYKAVVRSGSRSKTEHLRKGQESLAKRLFADVIVWT